MDPINIFISTFALVFIGELGDKTQIATGTGTLANPKNTNIIFWSSSIALMTVSGLTVLFTGFLPENWMPYIKIVGGIWLIYYGITLFKKDYDIDSAEADLEKKEVWLLFRYNFIFIFINELGDKTQYATMGSAFNNHSSLLIVFLASTTALVTVTALTVWGASKIPSKFVPVVQKAGAVGMIIYGIYMLT